jgi:hypothetical protein
MTSDSLIAEEGSVRTRRGWTPSRDVDMVCQQVRVTKGQRLKCKCDLRAVKEPLSRAVRLDEPCPLC